MKKAIYVLIIIISMFILNNSIKAWSEYKIGDIVPYNDMEFYVIKNSGSNEDSVTMLKAEPLTVEEVNQFGAGHVNRYTSDSVGTANNINGYGGMQYYGSSTCGYNGSSWVNDVCTTDYASSEIKYVVDAWKTAQAPAASEARLITIDDASESLGYEFFDNGSVLFWQKTENTPSWVYNSNYQYWTMSQYNDSMTLVWGVGNGGSLDKIGVDSSRVVVRPVITLAKTVLDDVDDSKNDDNNEAISDKQEDNKEIKTKVKVENTYMRKSVIILISGFILACASIVIYYIIKKKKGE